MNDHEPNSFDDFADRFNSLMVEASTYGLDSIIVLREHNRLEKSNDLDKPIQGTEMVEVGYSSGKVLSLGLAHYAVEFFNVCVQGQMENG